MDSSFCLDDQIVLRGSSLTPKNEYLHRIRNGKIVEVMEGNPTNNDLYHDLPRHLNDMLKEISDEKNKEMIIQNINLYYDSLNTLLIKHTIEHPHLSKS